MKTRRLGSIVFFASAIIVFLAGDVFTFLHRYDSHADFISKTNLLAITAACFLTVGGLALLYLHSLIDSKEFWRRVTAYALSIALCGTITYAAMSEAKVFVEEGNLKNKSAVIASTADSLKASAKGFRERSAINSATQDTLKQTLAEFKSQSFTPFAVNFFFGLICILTGSLIQPREAWKRKRGNQMTPEIRERAKQKMGFDPPLSAAAFENGRGDSYIIKHGREYLTTIPKRVDGE